jgi:hypothetical protein
MACDELRPCSSKLQMCNQLSAATCDAWLLELPA